MANICNAFGGVGANTHNWSRDKHDITHIEYNKEIARCNEQLHPEDTVVVEDAIIHLENNWDQYDYIWASPPCPSHSSIRKAGAKKGQYTAKMPDMDLYSVIVFLDEFFQGEFTVENVKPYYKRLDKQEREKIRNRQTVIPPASETSRHLFWSSHEVPEVRLPTQNIHHGNHSDMTEWLGIPELNDYTFQSVEKRKVLRNCVHPKIGEAILKSKNVKQQKLQVSR